MGVARRKGTGPGTGAIRAVASDADRRRNGGTAAVAAALLIALLFSLPFLQLRMDDVDQRLHLLARRQASQRASAQERVQQLKLDLQRRVRDGSRSQEDALDLIEDHLDRTHPRPRPVSELRIPEPSPLPHEVAPAVQPHVAPPEPKPAVASSGQSECAADAAPALDEGAEQVVAQWTAELDRPLQLTGLQRDRCADILRDYQRQLLDRREQILHHRGGVTIEDCRAVRDGILRRIEGILTAEQLARYQDIERTESATQGTGGFSAPLPGTGIPRRQ